MKEYEYEFECCGHVKIIGVVTATSEEEAYKKINMNDTDDIIDTMDLTCIPLTAKIIDVSEVTDND